MSPHALASTRAFRARYSEFEAVRDHVSAACGGVAVADQQRVVLVLEELFCNSVEHGYGGESDQPVWVRVALQPGGCRITYQDRAPEHDPFDQPGAPLADAGIDEREVGGLGVLLLTRLSSSHAYQRLDGRNVVTIELAWKNGAAGAPASPG